MIKEKYLGNRKTERDLPALGELIRKFSIKEVEIMTKEVFRYEPKIGRKAALYLCHRYSGMTLKEIGSYFGIGESAVSQNSRRFQLALDKDSKLKRKIEQIKKDLNL